MHQMLADLGPAGHFLFAHDCKHDVRLSFRSDSDDLQHLHCLSDISAGKWVRNLHELHWHVGMSGLDVPFGIACNLAGELQLTSGDPYQPDPFLQVIMHVLNMRWSVRCGCTCMAFQSPSGAQDAAYALQQAINGSAHPCVRKESMTTARFLTSRRCHSQAKHEMMRGNGSRTST